MMQRLGIRPFLSGVIAWMLALAGQRALQAGGALEGGLLLGAGALLFVAGFWSHRFDPMRAPDSLLVRLRRLPREAWAIRTGVGLLVLSMLLSLNALQQFYELEPDAPRAWLWHGASLLAALVGAAFLDHGLGFVRRLGGGSAPVDSAGRTPVLASLTDNRAVWGGVALLIGVLLVSMVYRLLRFDELPFGVWYDEAEHGLQALRILSNDRFRPIFEGAITGPAHYLYLVAVAFHWFGISVQSIRLVSVAMGVLTVLAGYLAAAELFGRRMALVTAVMLAVSSWAVTLSRFGMYSTITTPLFTLLTAAFMLRGLRTQRMTDYALAGLWLGLGLCFYTSFRTFVPVVFAFLIYLALYTIWMQRKAPPPSFWFGMVMIALLAAIAISPLAVYATKHPEIFWSRVEDTFIFAGKSEAERWPALWENLRRHVLMFNFVGDPNGRHNFPGAPMLDTISASLLVLGTVYALRRMLQPSYLLLLLWMAAMLMPGVLTLDFEAPQSLRANGTLPVAYLLATIPLAVLARAWALAAGDLYPHALRWPAAALMLGIAALNFNTYFDRQANDFASWNAYSTPETLTARLLAGLDPQTDAYVTSFFNGHPTIKFLARDARPYAELDTLDQFPLDLSSGRGALLILNADSRNLFDEAKSLYPNAIYEEIRPPVDGPPVLFTVRLSAQDVDSVRGLTARYYGDAAWSGTPVLTRIEPEIATDWGQAAPVPMPFSVEWDGILHVDTSGAHEFYLDAPAAAELLVGERSVLSGTGVLSGALSLAEGNHSLRVRAVGAPQPITLAWRTPDKPTEVIPYTALYNAPGLGHGLLGRYFENGDWQEPEAFSRIDARFGRYVHVIPLQRPYTVEWTGKIAAPVDGIYNFGLESIDESELWIDGVSITRADQPNTLVEGQIELLRGLHDIRIRFADRTDHTHINFYWQPPGGQRQIVPPEVLYPPQDSYEHVELPSPQSISSLETLVAGGETSPSTFAEPVLGGTAQVVVRELVAPRGVAVAPDGTLFVGESEAGRVAIVAADGQRSGLISGGEEPLGEPTDLAVGADRVYVLDAGAGRVRAFTIDGAPAEYATTLNPDAAGRSRGLAARPQGGVAIANTPNGRIVLLDAEGAETMQAAVWPGEDAQPVDVVIGVDGSLFVADSQGHRLIRYTADMQRDRSWPLEVANTVDSPHLAVDAAGAIYITEPERGRILKRDAQGEPLGAWNLNEMLGYNVRPIGIAVGSDGVIWVTDSAGGALIALTPSADVP